MKEVDFGTHQAATPAIKIIGKQNASTEQALDLMRGNSPHHYISYLMIEEKNY